MTHEDNFYHDLCEHLGFICLALDRDGKIRFANKEACRHLGQSESQLSGQPFIEFLGEADRTAAGEFIRNSLEQKSSGETEVSYGQEDDGRRTFVLIVSPIVDANDAVQGVSLCMRDISERKRLSKDLARARRMTALGKMSGAVAHHFNNILGGMLTSIDYALPSDSPRELRKTLRLLSHSIGRATRITQQLAAFAESENARHNQTSLDLIMADFVNALRSRCEKAGIELATKIELAPSGPFDESRLASVLEGVAQNSLDAMSEGGKLTIEMSHDATHATIHVTDSGCGIPDDVLEHIFEPFFTTKGGLGGGEQDNIGLGLAAVHGLVAEMGGTVSATSKVGKGTTIEIRLPLFRELDEPLGSPNGN